MRRFAIAAALFAFELARSATATEETQRRVVRVVVAGDDEQAAALEASLREMLARLSLTVEERRAERLDLEDPTALGVPSPDALATAWVDLRAPLHATVVLVDGAGHVVEKRMIPSSGSPAIAIEGVAQVVYASAEDIVVHNPQPHTSPIVILAPQPVATMDAPRENVPPPLVPALPRAAESTRWALFASAFVAGSTYGTGAPIVAIGGLGVDAVYQHARVRPSLHAWIASDVPFSVAGSLVALDTTTLGARVAPTLRLFNASTFSIEAGVGGGADILWISPRGTGLPASFVKSQTTDASAIATALATARVAIGNRVDFVVTAACDFDLVPRRYVIDDGPNVLVVFQPWPVRPSLSIGFDVLAAGRRAP